jgi:hypothetical protein
VNAEDVKAAQEAIMEEAQSTRESTGELMSSILYSRLTADSVFKVTIMAQ